MVRLPDGMRDKIAEVAKINNRSMNAEIIARLEQSFLPAKGMESGDMAAILALLHELVSKKKT